MAVSKYTVRTFVNGIEANVQFVNKASELVDNGYVVFDKEVELEADAGINFEGGSDGTESEEAHQEARNAFESYAFNILAVGSADEATQDAYIDYTKTLRDEYGVKFQLVIPYVERQKEINHEGVIQVGNEVAGDDPHALVYWVAGAQAGCRVQDSVMAKEYNGKLDVKASLTRAQLEDAIEKGIFTLHKVGKSVVVLKDINSLTTITARDIEKKNSDFKQNQTMRVLDYVCIESANVFNSMFLGKVPNDEIGREALRSQLLAIRNNLAQRRAIAPYDENNLNVYAGKGVGDVIGYDAIQPRNAMEKLFLTINFLPV